MLSPSITTAICGWAPLPSIPSCDSASTGCAEQAESAKRQINKAVQRITDVLPLRFCEKMRRIKAPFPLYGSSQNPPANQASTIHVKTE